MKYETVAIDVPQGLARARWTQVPGHFFMVGSYFCLRCRHFVSETETSGECLGSDEK